MTQRAMPVEHQQTLTNLSLLYVAEGRWAEAYQTCRDALDVGQDIFGVAASDAGRQDAVARGGQLSILATYSALRLGRFDEGLAQLEAGRARLLAEALALNDANLEHLKADERERLQELREAVRNYQYEARLPAGHPARREERQIAEELRAAWAALRAHLADLRGRYPDFLPEGLALDALLKLIPAGGALVAPLFTPQGSAVFVVPGGTQTLSEEQVIRLDDFTLDNLYALTRERDGAPGWLGYYIDYRFGRSGSQALLAGIEDVTGRLWEQLVGPIHAHLKTLGIQQDAPVLIMPQGDSNRLPLHAAWRIVDGQRRYFMDDYAISYTPSMSALASAKRRTPSGQGALVAGVSKYPTLGDLPNARAEAEGIAELFKAQALLDDAATVQAVIDGAPGKAFVHLSCHGGYAWGGDAFASALSLAGEAALPLAAIIAQLDLRAAPLVTLSACETGIVDVENVPDEFVGLPAAFMQAGARAVISSLWTVEDRSTALLMERMYQHMFDAQNPLPPMQALRAAQVWLRSATGAEIGEYYQSFLIPRMSQAEASAAYVEITIMKGLAPHEKPYERPYYWAAFTYSGV
ncbi:MAG: CHAT domain-containing protein [Anaerolineae bacterium]|nr:CHAT domain-containing protein [Anaerolineae bacterium]